MKDNKIIISLLILICIFSIILSFFVFKIYRKENKNIDNKTGKILIAHIAYINNSGKISSTNTLIFQIDSNDKCTTCRRLLTLPDKKVLEDISVEATKASITGEPSNILLQDYTVSYNTDEYNNLTEDEIKDKIASSLSNYIGEDKISFYYYKF